MNDPNFKVRDVSGTEYQIDEFYNSADGYACDVSLVIDREARFINETIIINDFLYTNEKNELKYLTVRYKRVYDNGTLVTVELQANFKEANNTCEVTRMIRTSGLFGESDVFYITPDTGANASYSGDIFKKSAIEMSRLIADGNKEMMEYWNIFRKCCDAYEAIKVQDGYQEAREAAWDSIVMHYLSKDRYNYPSSAEGAKDWSAPKDTSIGSFGPTP